MHPYQAIGELAIMVERRRRAQVEAEKSDAREHTRQARRALATAEQALKDAIDKVITTEVEP